ncbi:MAG: alkaline phosphatase family protein [Anaerolineae bacterium]|nr:alkaline phosphatase family protein [Anaerolineae bacterium]
MTHKNRVLIVGVDGADPNLTALLMSQGKLPHLADLCARGAWGPLQTTFPPVSPVAWMTCLSGVSPREHGIHDFITKADGSYLPTIGLFNVRGGVDGIPAYSSRRIAPTLAERLAEAGKRAYILQVPGTFPPMPVNGGVLAGFGMPDLVGSFGVSAWYTTDLEGKSAAAPDGAGLIQPLDVVGGGVWRGQIAGPGKAAQGFTLYRSDEGVALALDAGAGLADAGFADAKLGVGEWSGWLRLAFDVPGVGRVPGLCRFKLVSLGQRVELYRTAVQCAPDMPLFQLSEPPGFGATLQEMVGPFATIGMPSDLDGVRRGVVDLDTFLQDAYFNWERQVEMALRLMVDVNWDLLFAHLFTVDNVQHLFWHCQDELHLAYTTENAKQYGNEIENAYCWIDEQLGRMLACVDKNTTVMVVSDHGVLPIHRLIYVNAWLRAQGYLEPREADRPGQTLRLDWDRTQAAMFGTGGIWLNVQGRDPRGVIGPGAAYESLRKEIAQALLDWRDPASGRPIIGQVFRGEQVFGEYARQHGPDLLPALMPGYGLGRGEGLGRVMSGTPLSGVPLIVDNRTPWTGGHEGPYLPSDVPGLGIFCGPGFEAGQSLGEASLLDIAPTVLVVLGVDGGAAMVGRPL